MVDSTLGRLIIIIFSIILYGIISNSPTTTVAMTMTLTSSSWSCRLGGVSPFVDECGDPIF